jgi:hypothetical protein
MEFLLMGWPGRAQRPKATVKQDGEALKLKELTMHTHRSQPHRNHRPGHRRAIPSTWKI